MNIDANVFNKILEDQIQWSIKTIIDHNKVKFIPVLPVWFKPWKSINEVPHTNRLINHMIITIDAEKAFDKIQDSFIIKSFSKQGVEGNFLNLIKYIYQKNPTANIILNAK